MIQIQRGHTAAASPVFSASDSVILCMNIVYFLCSLYECQHGSISFLCHWFISYILCVNASIVSSCINIAITLTELSHSYYLTTCAIGKLCTWVAHIVCID